LSFNYGLMSRNILGHKKAFQIFLMVIATFGFLSLAHGAEQEQKKTLISLIHSGTDPVGVLLFNQVREQIASSDNFQLASPADIPTIRLELITFDPDEVDTEFKGISSGYSSIWISTEGYHIMAAAGVCGRDRLQPLAGEIVAKTSELIPTAQQHNAKSSEASLRHIVSVDLLKENDELRDRVAELEAKVYALEMELAAAKGKSWWQRLWGY
jgi:hypothetical protein